MNRYLVNIDNDPIEDWQEVYEWLQKHYEDQDWSSCAGPHKDSIWKKGSTSNFYFKRKTEAILFRLVWA